MKNPYNFQEYELLFNNKKSNKAYTLFILLFLIGILFIICKFNFRVYQKYTLLKQDNNYALIIEANNLNFIEEKANMYINEKRYKYKIDKINEEFNNINGTIYQTIIIKPINYKSKASIVDVYFLKSNKTIINMIIEFIHGGFKNEKIK